MQINCENKSDLDLSADVILVLIVLIDNQIRSNLKRMQTVLSRMTKVARQKLTSYSLNWDATLEQDWIEGRIELSLISVTIDIADAFVFFRICSLSATKPLFELPIQIAL